MNQHITPKITILMTTYNGMAYLDECIQSVLNQDHTDFEFLIIDDASTDGTYEFVKSIKDQRIKLFRNEINIGQTASLNIGLKMASGEIILRLDQDDVCLKSRVREQSLYMQENHSIVVACSFERTITNTNNVVRNWKRKIQNRGDFVGYIILGLCPVWHPSAVFRKSKILELGGYDTKYGPAEDYHLWSKIAASGYNGSVIPKYHLLQRNHQQSQSALAFNAQKKLLSMLRNYSLDNGSRLMSNFRQIL